MKIAVLNYNAGNLTSVKSALQFIGSDFFITSDVSEFEKADAMIMPGVGDIGFAMNYLKKNNWVDSIINFCNSKKPFLGICVGAQSLFSKSEEGMTDCFNLVFGQVKKFDQNLKLKIPHMGWNQVETKKGSMLFKKIPDKSSFYFVHSYYMQPQNSEVIAGTTNYGINFCSAIESENIFATQFHPEKSGEVGLQILKNFINIG